MSKIITKCYRNLSKNHFNFIINPTFNYKNYLYLINKRKQENKKKSTRTDKAKQDIKWSRSVQCRPKSVTNKEKVDLKQINQEKSKYYLTFLPQL